MLLTTSQDDIISNPAAQRRPNPNPDADAAEARKQLLLGPDRYRCQNSGYAGIPTSPRGEWLPAVGPRPKTSCSGQTSLLVALSEDSGSTGVEGVKQRYAEQR
jgi:hypothetical protein